MTSSHAIDAALGRATCGGSVPVNDKTLTIVTCHFSYCAILNDAQLLRPCAWPTVSLAKPEHPSRSLGSDRPELRLPKPAQAPMRSTPPKQVNYYWWSYS